MSYEIFIGKRYLRGKKGTKFISAITIISIIGIVTGVTALITTIGVMSGFEKDLKEKIVGMNAEVFVFSVINNTGILGWHPLIETIKKVPDVKAVSPFVEGQAIVTSPLATYSVSIRGIDANSQILTTSMKNYIKVGTFKLKDSTEIIIGKELAQSLGVGIGNQLTVIFPPKQKISLDILRKMGPRPNQFIVRGIFQSGMYEYDTKLAFISLESAQKAFGLNDTITGICCKIKDIYRANNIKLLIEEQLGPFYIVKTWAEMNKNLFAALRLEKTVMFILLALIIIVAAFSITATLIMTVMEKTKEIGILKAIGATSVGIAKIFIFEGLMIGLIGTILGTGLGIGLCWIMGKSQFFKLPQEIYYITSIPVNIRFWDICIIDTVSIVLTLLATLYPSIHAAKLHPVEALRYE